MKRTLIALVWAAAAPALAQTGPMTPPQEPGFIEEEAASRDLEEDRRRRAGRRADRDRRGRREPWQTHPVDQPLRETMKDRTSPGFEDARPDVEAEDNRGGTRR